MGPGFGPDWARWAGSDRGKKMGARPEGTKNRQKYQENHGKYSKICSFWGSKSGPAMARPRPGLGLPWPGLGLAWASLGPNLAPHFFPRFIFSPFHFFPGEKWIHMSYLGEYPIRNLKLHFFLAGLARAQGRWWPERLLQMTQFQYVL